MSCRLNYNSRLNQFERRNMEALTVLIVTLVVTVFVILITRWLGAWMLRINEVIELLKRIDTKLDNEPVRSLNRSDV